MTKITTPEALLSYEHLFQPMAPEGSGAEPQYSACLVFNKETDLSDLKKAVDDAGRARWGDKYTSLKESDSLRLPFRTDSLKEKATPMDQYTSMCDLNRNPALSANLLVRIGSLK